MAIYHLNLKTVGRNDGRSATAAAAYRAGCVVEDRRTGLKFDYSRKSGCDGAELLTPLGAPDWTKERTELWNRVELFEKRKDAQLAREVEFALPIELRPEDMKRAARAFVEEQFVALGMVADLAFHHLEGQNPHAHCLLTMRPLMLDGFGPKERAWNDRAMCDRWREAWALHANKALAEAGRVERIDHRPLTEQALDVLTTGTVAQAMALNRMPTVHEARDLAAVLANDKIREENKARAVEWAGIEALARAEARLMAPSDDDWPKEAATSAPSLQTVPAAPRGRPQEVQPVDADVAFRNGMASNPGLKAVAWRAADRDVFSYRQRLDALTGEEARRFAARERAERDEATAQMERRIFVERNPQPRNWWIFNRRERAAWAARLFRRDSALKKAQRARAEASREADLVALSLVEKERATAERRLSRALAERQRHGALPSETLESDKVMAATDISSQTTEPTHLFESVSSTPRRGRRLK
ncbi:MobQ family relaxase [Arenimonas alkanexedens]